MVQQECGEIPYSRLASLQPYIHVTHTSRRNRQHYLTIEKSSSTSSLSSINRPRITDRHHAYLRRYLQRSEDLPRQGMPLPLSISAASTRLREAAAELHIYKGKGTKREQELTPGCDSGQTLHPRRQQNLSLPERQNRVPLPAAQESSSYCLDRVIPEAA